MSKKKRSASLVIWLNTRRGFYDGAIIDQLCQVDDQDAFNRYINECERAYKASFNELVKQDLAELGIEKKEDLSELGNEFRDFLIDELWPSLLRISGGDKQRAKELIRLPQYAALVKDFDLAEAINDQYLNY